MATASKLSDSDSRQARVYQWTLDTSDRNGEYIEVPDHADRSIQVTGTFGASAQVVVDGSNDGGSNGAELNDPQGDPIALTGASIAQIQEATHKVRPRLESGDGSTSVVCSMFVRAQP